MTTPADHRVIRRRADQLVENHREFMKSLIATRTKHRLTQAEVAERMGVSQPTVAAFERYDSNPTLATVRRYALAVEATLEDRVIDDCGRCLEDEQRQLEPVATIDSHQLFLAAEPVDDDWFSAVAGNVRVVHDVVWAASRPSVAALADALEWESVASGRMSHRHV